MHAAIQRYKCPTVTITVEELVQVGREMASNLSQAKGFVSLLILDSSPELPSLNAERNQVLAIVSIFEDQASLEQVNSSFPTPLDKRLAAGCPEQVEVTIGQIIFQRGL